VSTRQQQRHDQDGSITMPDQHPIIFVGIDTHGDTHHVALVDPIGRHLADRQFDATGPGYRLLLQWISAHGRIQAVGVEGTGSYGAEIARVLRAAGQQVIEVDRPDRKIRRHQGKTDPIDAYAAAIAVASGRANGTPKTRDGAVEAIRTLRVARTSAIKARTQAINQMRSLLVTAPEPLRARFRGIGAARRLVDTVARLRPGTDLSDPGEALKATLRHLARRYQLLDEEIGELDETVQHLVRQHGSHLLALPGVGPDTAAQLLITAGDNSQRLRNEASFAHLCGAAPIPASSGKRDRHRLNRAGDRQANRALHIITIVRMRHDERTRAYVERRTAEGLSKKEIIRCLKRHIAREIYKALTRENSAFATTADSHALAA
jgi:transposase